MGILSIFNPVTLITGAPIPTQEGFQTLTGINAGAGKFLLPGTTITPLVASSTPSTQTLPGSPGLSSPEIETGLLLVPAVVPSPMPISAPSVPNPMLDPEPQVISKLTVETGEQPPAKVQDKGGGLGLLGAVGVGLLLL